MEKIRDFVNRHTTISLMLMLGVTTLFSFSCDPVDENNIDRLEEHISAQVSMLSIGPRRDENIIVRPAL